MIPQYLFRYFWEVDASKVDVQKRARYIIERILEYGDMDAVKWMFNMYPKKVIVEVLKSSRSLSRKSANHWALIFEVLKSQILGLSKNFKPIIPQPPKPLWISSIWDTR